MNRNLKNFLFFVLMVGVSILPSCNFFSVIDSPGGDTQLISAARACFDQGDFTCALDHYSQLSDSESDVNHSESAFTILHENGIGMGQFMTAFGTGSSGGGKVLTDLANLVASDASQTKRTAVYEAYKKIDSINQSELKGQLTTIKPANS